MATGIQEATKYHGMMPGHVPEYQAMIMEVFGYAPGVEKSAAKYGKQKGNPYAPTASNVYGAGNPKMDQYMEKFMLGLGMGMGKEYAKMAGKYGQQQNDSMTDCNDPACPHHGAGMKLMGGLEGKVKNGYGQRPGNNYSDKKYNDIGSKASGYSDSNAYKA